MTAKEYLGQACRLDQRIKVNILELERLRELATRISSPSFGEKVSGLNNVEPSFVGRLSDIIDMEQQIKGEIEKLVALKKEIREVIGQVDNPDELMVLRYRYIHNYTWRQISDELIVDQRTVRRWHADALIRIKIPSTKI